MKTANEWQKFFQDNCIDKTSCECIEMIQADAAQRGMELAEGVARIRQESMRSVAGCEDRINTCINIRHDISLLQTTITIEQLNK
jgi:hypothetical protein